MTIREPNDPWESFAYLVDRLRDALARHRAIQVNSGAVRGAARKAVTRYFQATRPYLVALRIEPTTLVALERELQALLKLSAGRHSRQAYFRSVRRIRSLSRSLDAQHAMRKVEQTDGQAQRQGGYYEVEARIIETLSGLVPTAALSYEQAIRDLRSQDRLSYRGPANELREALRETIDHLAPDEKVMKIPGFTLEPEQSKPTQKQKVRFILRSRDASRTAMDAPEQAVSLVEELTASLARSVYARSSIPTHVATGRRDVLQVKLYVDSVLAELLQIHR